ncbi:toll/interleukin-1 receptor domain-containing protein [Paractinoplanes durhamensis]|uniref:TIR domain-containing protein n=1 Tax=Paractinoplanes durhamensis TaxID=113563 RepID=A0ABQ3ZAY5_9ACTN|nr:toll/interleukin-1 receptor domain-containing protein [Actinoplanes durhamensis]GIE07000.1 hypothetical protein Adu01nite_83500 [Actinoplanes durhamensis]
MFDNAEDREDAVGFLPDGPGHVIITSRNPNWTGVADSSLVDVFDRLDSVSLLQKHMPTLTDAEADEVALALGDLPLALGQAADLLAETGMSPGSFIDLLDQHAAELFSERAPVGYAAPLAAMVRVTADWLRAAGIEVWLDRTHLVAGDRWADVIRKSIVDGDFFIACFSEAHAQRTQTYMNEELVFAVDQLRRRGRDRRWFIPVKLDHAAIPGHSIGAGETFSDIHFVDLSGDWALGMGQLVRAITRPEA